LEKLVLLEIECKPHSCALLDGDAVFDDRLKAPLLDRIDSSLIEGITGFGIQHMRGPNSAIGGYCEANVNRSLDVTPAG
jgi:hypothetical protein